MPPQLHIDSAAIEHLASNEFPFVITDLFIENENLANYAKQALETTMVKVL